MEKMEKIDISTFLKSTQKLSISELQDLCEVMQSLSDEEIAGFNEYATRDSNYDLSKIRIYSVKGFKDLSPESKNKVKNLFRLLTLPDQNSIYDLWKMTNNLEVTAGILPPPKVPSDAG